MTGALGVKESAELFEKHLRLFMYFKEYHTELREKLRFFPLFLDVLEAQPLVYQYYMEKYPREEKIRLYFDFVEANRAVLEAEELSDWQKTRKLIGNDGLSQRFAQDPYGALIAEIYRISSARIAMGEENAKPFTDFYSVSPRALESCTRLQDCPQSFCMVTWSRNEEGKIQMQIRST